MNVVRRIGKQTLCIMLSAMMVWSLIPGLSYSLVYAEDGGAPAQSQAVEESVDKSDKASEAKASAEAAEEAEAKEEKAEAKEEKESPKAEEPKEEPKAEEPKEEPKAEAPAAEPKEAAEEESGDELKEEASEDVSEDTEEAEEDVSEDTEEAGAYGGKYSKDLETVAVDVETADDAFKEEVKLVVKPLDEDSDEYADAEKALKKNKQTYAGMLAFDIHFENAKGKEIEPSGPVSVTMNAKKKALEDISIDAFDAESVQVTHIGERATEVVADTADETDGTVDVNVGTKAVKSIESTFEVENFSTFVLTWGTNQSATIHFGTTTSTGFKEFDEEQITFDTTATSINVANTFDGYTYRDAVYCEPGETFSDGIDMEAIVTKNDNGTWSVTKPAAEGSEATSVPIANGSNIYVTYYAKGSPSPSGAGDDTIPSPTTVKTVKPNGDGTYTVQIDVTGATVTEDNSHYVNVLIVLDATTSMSGTKWTNAKAAMKTLIETLSEGDNAANAGKIDYALVTFGRAATVRQTGGSVWTKNNTAFKQTCDGINMVTTSGTNWESGMRGGLYGALSSVPDNDPTYVIFLTDGDPNTWYNGNGARDEDNGTNYDDTGTRPGYQGSSSTAASRAKDEAKAIAATTKLYGIYCGSSGTTPSGDSFNRLVDVIEGTGQGGQDTIAANADTIEEEFKKIAETALKDIGANNVAVDDGVPQLASVSSAVAGTPGGYEYYKKGSEEGAEFQKWTDAPGASFSDENGVTWDLSKVGSLEPDTTYRIKFTLWPSQAAYDTIADLNNGVITMTQEQLDAEGIGKDSNGKYYLLTNTHLNTTYKVKDQTYSDSPEVLPEEEMPLPTETIKVKKVWNNLYDPDQHDGGEQVKLWLTKDGTNYLYGDKSILVTAKGPDGQTGTSDDWTAATEIYISCGQITQTSDGYKVIETGHDYAIAEPPEYAYHWDLTSDVYRPMVINGTAHYLIMDDDATGEDGKDYYIIKGSDGKDHKYKLSDGAGNNVLTATNDRRSHLDFKKALNDLSDDQGADPNKLYEFTCNFTKTTEDVYFSAYADGSYQEITGEGIQKEMKDGSWTGYYYAPAGTAFTIKIKKDWSIRFLNLLKGTEYSITEGSLSDGYAFVNAEGTDRDFSTGTTTSFTPDVEATTISGAIEKSNHRYTVIANNKYEPSGAELTVQKNWVSTLGITTHGDINVALFKDANEDGKVTSDEYIKGSLKKISSPSTSVKYDKLSSLEGIIVREVTVTTEGDVTTVTPVDAGGTIAVTGETVSGKDGTYSNTYTAAYEVGTASDNSRIDTITNTLDEKKIVRDVSLTIKKVDGATAGTTGLEGAVFTLTNTSTQETKTYTTGSGGTVTITFSGYETTENVNQSKSTTYTLKETTAPTGYTANDTEYTVTVSENQVSVTQNTETKAWEWLYNLILSILGKDGTDSSDFANGVLTVTNPPTTQNISVEKVWKDTDSSKRPEEISVTLLADGEPVSQSGITATQKLNSGNQWKYTWNGLYTTKDGKDIAYTVKEDVAIDGYATAYSGSETAGFTITNSNVTLDTSEKFFKKTVPQGSESKQSAATFKFTAVQVADAQGTAMESDTAWTNSKNVDYAKGEYGTKPVDFGKITYTEAGTYYYKVTEDTPPAGWAATPGTEVIVTVTVTGNALDGFKVSVDDKEITNKYSVGKTNITLSASKTLVVESGNNAPDVSEKYTLTLKDSTGETLSTKTNPDGNGTAVAFDTIEYTEPGTYTYTVEESGTVAGVTNGTTSYTVTVTVTDNGDGTMTAAVTSGSQTTAFTNTYKVTPTEARFPVKKVLEVPKGLTPASIAGKFTFTLTAAQGTPMPTVTSYTNPAADGGTVSFGDITYSAPGTYTYTVTESGSADGVTNDTTLAKTVTVTVVDNGNGTLTATASSTTENPLTFTNKYDVTPTEASFPVKKVLEVPEGLTPGSIAGKFTFTLTAVDGAPLVDLDGNAITTEKKNPDDNGGTVTFGDIAYKAPGTYEYTVTETGSADGVTNDTTTAKKVTVTVVDNGDGTLTATADSTTDNPLTFTNKYDVKPTKASFPVEKILDVEEGLKAPDITEAYTFELTAAEGTPMPETTSYKNPDADGGTVTFGEIEYDAPGTYTYTVTETGEVKGVANDPAAEAGKTVTVTVVDNGDGTLTATPSVDADSPLQFTNTYSVDKVGATIPAVKILEVPDGLTAPDITEKYTFTLEAVDGAPLVDLDGNAITTEKKNPAATGGSISFGTIAFTKPGTYKYTITEAGTVPGITNDQQATKEVTIVVTDNSDGTMTAVVNDGKEVVFTNSYSVKPTEASFPVKKVLEVPEGLTPGSIAGKFTFTLTAVDGAPLVDLDGNAITTEKKNPDDNGGTVTFGDIAYKAPGTYEYTVTETGSADGVTNDTTTAKKVTVTVVDNSDGTLTATASSTTDEPLTFTNKYDVKPTKASFPVEKILDVEEGLKAPDITEKYTFTLKAADGTPMPENTSYKNPYKDGGTVTFGEIEYDAPGTYTYTVTETGEVKGVANDPAAEAGKTVTVTVVDNGDGTLTATPSVNADSPLQFTNTYSVDKVGATIPVVKILEVPDGLTAPDITEAYTFTLEAVDGAPLVDLDGNAVTTEKKNPTATGGSVSFGTIAFSKPGTYKYKVTEAGTVPGITNDQQATKEVTIVVTDNSDGTMTVVVNDGEEVVFTNAYSVEPTTTKAKVKKSVTAVDPAAESTTFSFELAAGTNTSAGGVDTPMPEKTKVEATFTEAGDLDVYFDEVEFKEPGVYNYTITEDIESLPGGWVVTGSPAEITITVTDNSDGTLTAVVSNATITNEYPTKKVEGVKNWNDQDYFDENGKPLNGYERKDITIKLLADGEETGKTVTLKAEDFKDLAPTEPWPFSFTDLPATDDHGESEIVYTVVEVTPEGWTSEVDDYEVINTPVDKEEVLNPTDLTIKKIDGTTDTGKGLEGAVFTLFDAENVGVGSYTTNDKGEVVVPFTQTGNSVGTYTLKETQAPTGYEPIDTEYKVVVEKDFIEVTFNKDKTVWQWIYDLIFGEESDFDTKTRILTIPNTPKKTEVEATKIWNDASNKDGVRPDEVTFQLYKTVNGVESIVEGKTITLSGDADTWTDKITDLWEYEDGYKIKYTFKELDASGNVVADGGILPGKDGAEYTAAYQEDGVTIRNSYQVSPDKDVTKAGVTIDGQPVKVGETLTYTISYINTSGKTADEVVIKDTPPKYTNFVAGSNKVVEGPDAESFNAGSELVWTFKDVADGTAITVSFDVKVDEKDAAGQTLINKASVNDKDTNEVINSVPKKEVFDSKTERFIDGEPVKIGQVLTYKITYKNVTGEQEEVVITDKIPELTEYVANSADNGGSESDGTITWNLTLEKDEEITVSFKVKVLDDVNGEILENTGNVKDAENDFDVDTNTTTNPTPRKLKIIKNLPDFVDHGEYVEASFAFEIKGYDKDGKEVYKNTIGMDFNAGQTYDEVLVKGIPSKAETVTVEEVYSGNYKPDETGAVKVSEVDGVYQVTFNNTKSDIEYKGGVTNHYGKDGDTYKYQPEQLVQ